jgi:hypothetical protein
MIWGIGEQAVAGERVAWVQVAGGNYTEMSLLTARVKKPQSTTTLVENMVHQDTGDWVGHVHGDGSLLVFNTWSVCYWETGDPSDAQCPPSVPPFTYHVYDEKLWRVVDGRKRLLVTSPDELTVLSVAAGRILVQRADGSLEIRGADGRLSHAYPFEHGQVLGAQLDASELVVLERASGLRWRVYDPTSGELTRTLPAPAGALPADVEHGILAYTMGRFVHVLRLRDGHRGSLAAPAGTSRVLAQIEPSGVFYSYSVRGQGRVRFVPVNEIRFR